MVDSIFWQNPFSMLCLADAREIPLKNESVHCVITSPPYWGLRDYSVEDGIGLESTFDEHLENLLVVGREIHRVLRDDGTFWLNYGDAYARGNRWDTGGHGGIGGRKGRITEWSDAERAVKLKPKNLMGHAMAYRFRLTRRWVVVAVGYCMGKNKPNARNCER